MESSLINRAQLLLEQNRPKEAAEILTQLLSQDPNNLHVLALLSETHLALNQPDKAKDIIENAIGLYPDVAMLHFIKAQAMADLGQFDKAEKSLTNATTLDPSDADYFALWAIIKNVRKQFTEALELSSRALELQPDNISALNAQSTALLKLDRKEESTKTIEGALKEDPNNPFTHANYGWSELENGNHKKALIHFQEALKNDPNMQFAQAGMMEALKARYFLYRVFLKYVFFMSNLTAKYQWAVIIGIYVGFRVLRSISESNPALAPFLEPLLIVMTIAAFSTWITTPLSNLFLRLNVYGKHLLNKSEIRSSNLVAICVIISLVGLIGYLTDASPIWIGLGAYGLGMMIPCSVLFASAKNKWAFPGYAIAMALIGILSLMNVYATGEIYNQFSTIFMLGFIGFQWFANFMMIKQSNL